MNEVFIKDWSQFEKFVNSHKPKKWIFRGQCDEKWKISTSFMRSLKEVQEIYAASGKEEMSHRDSFESVLIHQFKSQAHLYLNFNPKTELEWLTIMQHYGAPTRLTDWTFSPYVALFFALSQGSNSAGFYTVNQDRINKFYRIKTDSKNLEESLFNDLRRKDAYVFAFEPLVKNERMVRQQGLFMCASNNFESIDDVLLQDEIITNEDFFVKTIISEKMRFDALKKLKTMNISHETLFPGIEGFCCSLKLSLLNSSDNLKRII